MSTRLRPVDPHNRFLQKALDYNHLSSAPSTWRQDDSGILKQLGSPDDPSGTDVAVGEPIKASFGNELLHALPYFGAAVGMGGIGAALGGGAGAAAAGAAGASSAPLASSAIGSGFIPGIAGSTGMAGAGGALGSTAIGSGMAGLAPALSGSGASAGGGGVGIGSTLKDLFLGGNGHKGVDPTSLILGGLSLFGDNGLPDPYKGSTTNPEATLAAALSESHQLIDRLKSQGPTRLRMPDPISVPGLPFQIGGGFGQDENSHLPSNAPSGPAQLQGDPLSTAQFTRSPVRGIWDHLTQPKQGGR